MSGANAQISFTTAHTYQNADMGAYQVIWTGHNAGGATFRLMGTIDGTNYSNLTTNPTTITSGSDNALYNIDSCGYQYVKAVYVASAATTGTIDVWRHVKGRR